jgi:hypothetical protein
MLVLTAWEKDSEEEEKNDHIKNTLSFEKKRQRKSVCGGKRDKE